MTPAASPARGPRSAARSPRPRSRAGAAASAAPAASGSGGRAGGLRTGLRAAPTGGTPGRAPSSPVHATAGRPAFSARVQRPFSAASQDRLMEFGREIEEGSRMPVSAPSNDAGTESVAGGGAVEANDVNRTTDEGTRSVLAGGPVRGLRAVQAGEPGRTREELVAEIERLRRSSQLQSELVATVAHELRTPLTSIVGFTELLRNRELDAAALRHFVGIVNDEARRLARLIDELFDVQLMPDGATNLRIGVFDLADVLRGQVELFCAESRRHVLRVDVPQDALLVRGDRDRLTQVVANLLSNAIKYSPEGGVVAVTAEVLDGTVRVSVRDSGVGLAPDQHHLIFARFYRANDPRAAASRSVGLGLALSREIVRSHGGSFGFDSAVGEGSTFYFELRDALVREEQS